MVFVAILWVAHANSSHVHRRNFRPNMVSTVLYFQLDTGKGLNLRLNCICIFWTTTHTHIHTTWNTARSILVFQRTSHGLVREHFDWLLSLWYHINLCSSLWSTSHLSNYWIGNTRTNTVNFITISASPISPHWVSPTKMDEHHIELFAYNWRLMEYINCDKLHKNCIIFASLIALNYLLLFSLNGISVYVTRLTSAYQSS